MPPSIGWRPEPSRTYGRWPNAGGRPGAPGDRAEGPERLTEGHARPGGLVLVAGVRAPVRVDPVGPPRVGEVAQLRRRDHRPGRPIAQPAGDVLFRPEEVHRASREDDVVPPSGRRDQAVEQEGVIVGPA